MALAANVCPYAPPMRIQQMEADLVSLSQYWDEGPWGWSRATRHRYLNMGIPIAELPDDAWIDNIRRLSNRAFASEYTARLLSENWGGMLVGERMRFRTSSPHLGTEPLVFKLPWSSSGRGIVFSPDGLTPADEMRVRRFLHSQGGYIEDRFYANKRLDFAMEFFAHAGGGVEFLGYSVFMTGKRGTYVGNIVAPQSELIKLIGIRESLLRELVCYHCHHLDALGYQGPLGIDMMCLSDGRIHPVVEINFRRNMGILALTLCQRGMTGDAELTPAVKHGFQALVKGGVLSIHYKR